ncbi:polyprenyl synthetase family protein [Allobranchiibius sp. GilTou73]|uniref:polyprenyl synthetase family protein n=1 Tax=Allobranchiibius sp. GilTou73 TaxID=2904523 RepID=UPI001F460920|nr:polyprenyl synthetase family protein [Allobranchiibius sp. GilTou73]UIJ33613.1 polyprenyl synthetase family protein [Allobranchiibius sp. GilTou73]
MPDPLDVADLRVRVQAVLDTAQARQRDVLAPLGPDVAELSDGIFQLLRGGKRLRAAFLYWGYRAAGGRDSDALVQVATSMEMFQAAALIHDDVMDHSDTRRGMPTAHRRLAARHAREGWEGDGEDFGNAGAILAGDLCLVWTDELFVGSGLPHAELARGRDQFGAMRTQLMGGQFLDVLDSVRDWATLTTDQRIEEALRVVRYKSANYTVVQPLLIGADCAGVDASTRSALAAYGTALGDAFQLRDDLLGVFGDPEQTGKPAGDDLLEGKRTALVAFALDDVAPADLSRFTALFGSPDLDEEQVAWLRDLCKRSGAVDRVEGMIQERVLVAREQLRGAVLDDESAVVLHDLIDVATARDS